MELMPASIPVQTPYIQAFCLQKRHSQPSRVRACQVTSVVSDSVTPWTVARQAPLSMGFSRRGCLEWVASPSPSPSDLYATVVTHVIFTYVIKLTLHYYFLKSAIFQEDLNNKKIILSICPCRWHFECYTFPYVIHISAWYQYSFA